MRLARQVWRLKLSHQPPVGSARFHRIDHLDDGLMDMIPALFNFAHFRKTHEIAHR
jgi:hypothetical protein